MKTLNAEANKDLLYRTKWVPETTLTGDVNLAPRNMKKSILESGDLDITLINWYMDKPLMVVSNRGKKALSASDLIGIAYLRQNDHLLGQGP